MVSEVVGEILCKGSCTYIKRLYGTAYPFVVENDNVWREQYKQM